MKCISCESEINPKWKHAIENNICPCCGTVIMDEKLKNLLTSLGKTLDGLSEYQDQTNDWMLSNHNYIKTSSPDLANYLPDDILSDLLKLSNVKSKNDKKFVGEKFTVKVKTENGEEDVDVEKIQDEETTNDFFKRAEAVKTNIDGFKNPADKTKKLKSLVQQIKKNGSGSMASIDPGEYVSPEDIAEIEGYISGGAEVSSSLSNDSDDAIPPVVLAMAKRASNNNPNANAARELQKLQDLENRRASSKENSLNGKGAFSRS
jgi:Zn-finger nucleic acid-binding protein